MLFSLSELEKLTEKTGAPVVSIYIPTHRTGDTAQDPIRLKNILRAAKRRLVRRGIRTPKANQILEPATKLLDNTWFWQHQSDGLVLFLSPKTFQYYQLPYDFKEILMIGERCYMKPLLPLLQSDGMFYVLALSQNDVRLLQCTRHSQLVITPNDIPKSIDEALKQDEPEKQIHSHTTGSGPAIFHGHGVSKEYDKINISRFFKQVDRGLRKALKGEKAPLVLAAVDYLHPIYMQVNKYTHILDRGLTGNPDDLSETELRLQAWAKVEPLFKREQTQALSNYRLTDGTGLT